MMNNGFRSFTDHFLKGIQASENHMTEYVEKSVGIITAINPHLGYETAAEIAKEATLTGKSVRELCLQPDVLTEEEMDVLLNSFKIPKPGIHGEYLI